MFRWTKACRNLGSPPPMRGEGCVIVREAVSPRITPAYAGRSGKRQKKILRIRDHPRLCGEKRSTSLLMGWMLGSPPPMRGEDRGPAQVPDVNRITPAYAGRSFLKVVQAFTHGDHPRLCGEKWVCRPSCLMMRGSPPPMRGEDRHRHHQRQGERITPAYAGRRRAKRSW